MDGLTDAAIVALVPAVVEVAKRGGLPARFAGLAAVAVAVALYALRDVATGSGAAAHIATWAVSGLIAGLAASGLYSQVSRMRGDGAAV